MQTESCHRLQQAWQEQRAALSLSLQIAAGTSHGALQLAGLRAVQAASPLGLSGERCVKMGMFCLLESEHRACGKKCGEESPYTRDGGARVECGPLVRETLLSRAVVLFSVVRVCCELP